MEKNKKNKIRSQKTVVFLSVGLILLVLVFSFAIGFRKVTQIVSSYAFEKGGYYFNGGEYDLKKAEKWFKIMSYTRPGSSSAHYYLGRIYFVDGKLDEAMKEFDIAEKNNPELDEVYALKISYMKGLVYGNMGRYPDAQREFSRVTERDSKSWAPFNDLAWVYYEDGKLEEAEKAVKDGLEKFPDNAWLLNGAGVVAGALGKREEAGKFLEMAGQSAEKLNENDWKLSYSGNDPKKAGEKLAGFRDLIKRNKLEANLGFAGKGSFVSACNYVSYGVCVGIGTCQLNFDTTLDTDLCPVPTPDNPDGICYSNNDCCPVGVDNTGIYVNQGAILDIYRCPRPYPDNLGNAYFGWPTFVAGYYDWGTCAPPCTPATSCTNPATITWSGVCSAPVCGAPGTEIGTCPDGCPGGGTVTTSRPCTNPCPCTNSCGVCSAPCGGGTQTCTDASCLTYTQACNTQSCDLPWWREVP